MLDGCRSLVAQLTHCFQYRTNQAQILEGLAFAIFGKGHCWFLITLLFRLVGLLDYHLLLEDSPIDRGRHCFVASPAFDLFLKGGLFGGQERVLLDGSAQHFLFEGELGSLGKTLEKGTGLRGKT